MSLKWPKGHFVPYKGTYGYCHARQFGLLDNSTTRATVRKIDITTGFFPKMDTREKLISQQASETQAKRTK